jgi:hypothetical protein
MATCKTDRPHKNHLVGKISVCEYEYSQIDYAFKKTITPYVDQTIVKKVKKKAWLQGKVRNQ